MSERSDVLYRVYVTVLLLSVLAGPTLYTLVVSLSRPPLVTLLRHDQFPALVVATTGVLAAGALAVGRARGPVLLSPFRIQLVAGGPQPRRLSLRGLCQSPLLLVLLAGAILGALPPVALRRVGVLEVSTLPASIVAGATVGGLIGVAWLAGQSLRRWTVVWTALLCLLGAGILALWWPGPLGLTWHGVLSVATALCLLAVIPRLLDRLRGPVLLDQAQRWYSATTAGGAGDLAGATSTYRTRPQRPRPSGAIGSTTRLPVLFLRRDLVGTLRTPIRALVAVAALILAALMGALSTTIAGDMALIVVGASSVLSYLALGVWSDGFRHAVEASAAPTLYGLSDAQLMALHAILPVSVVLIVGTLAGLCAALLGGQPLMTAVAVGGALLCVVVRLFDAAKGPMPPILLTPAPTPMGDASALPIALWQADALLVAALVPTVIGAAVLSLGSGLPLLAYLPATAALLLALRRRLRTV